MGRMVHNQSQLHGECRHCAKEGQSGQVGTVTPSLCLNPIADFIRMPKPCGDVTGIEIPHRSDVIGLRKPSCDVIRNQFLLL